MSVPFGFSVGDFVALGTLAWQVYKATKGAPEAFQKIHIEVCSLHAVLKEAEETIGKSPLESDSQGRLTVVLEGCRSVLVELQELVTKYQSLGTQSKRTWDRMRWGNEDITEFRDRLNTSATLLTAFISTSQASILQKLDEFLNGFKNGRKENTIVTVETLDSLNNDDRTAWRTIRKELEEIGISVAAFEANHDLILDWFKHTLESGGFDEQDLTSEPDDNNQDFTKFSAAQEIERARLSHRVHSREIEHAPNRSKPQDDTGDPMRREVEASGTKDSRELEKPPARLYEDSLLVDDNIGSGLPFFPIKTHNPLQASWEEYCSPSMRESVPSILAKVVQTLRVHGAEIWANDNRYKCRYTHPKYDSKSREGDSSNYRRVYFDIFIRKDLFLPSHRVYILWSGGGGSSYGKIKDILGKHMGAFKPAFSLVYSAHNTLPGMASY